MLNKITGPHIALSCFLTLVGFLTLAVSCSRAADVPDIPDREPRCMIGIDVSLGNVVTETTRANPPLGPGYEPGAGLENRIDPEDLCVYLFSTDNKLIARLSDSGGQDIDFSFQPSESGDGAVYRMTFRVDKLLENAYTEPQSFKIVMLANWGKRYYDSPLVPGETTISDITEHTSAVGNFDAVANEDGSWSAPALGERNLIPFYGVQQYDGIVFLPGKNKMLEERLLLLRAFAKIDVCDAPDTAKPIKSVTLSRHNTRYYKAPLGVFHHSQYTDYDYASDFLDNPSLPTDPYEWESALELKLAGDGNGHFVAYVPEYKNIGRTDGNAAVLTLDYGDGNVYTLDFKYYDKAPEGSSVGDPYDIRRNNWYKFIVKRSSTGLTLTADVIPYLPVELDPIFGLTPKPKPEPGTDTGTESK